MIKIVTIVGARPQIIKSAALSRAIKADYSNKIKEVIVHTGQHYDQNMSDVFFKELNIPSPDHQLNVRSGTHAAQTAAMMIGIEAVLIQEKPDCLIVYGDTNSTLAGAIAASKLHIPIVHVEAGLRSNNKKMPEEINRVLCDHVSTLLFSPSESGYLNLMREGFNENSRPPYTVDRPKIYHCGDVMYDNALHFSALAELNTNIVQDLELLKDEYILATIHRDYNTDHALRMNEIFSALLHLAETDRTIVIPLHPRTDQLLQKQLEDGLFEAVTKNKRIKIIPPVSYLEMIALEKNSKLIMTDSGGVQKEAFFFKKPCIILRSETEWLELTLNGNAVLVDASKDAIVNAFDHFIQKANFTYPAFYGDGRAAYFICSEILSAFAK